MNQWQGNVHRICRNGAIINLQHFDMFQVWQNMGFIRKDPQCKNSELPKEDGGMELFE